MVFKTRYTTIRLAASCFLLGLLFMGGNPLQSQSWFFFTGDVIDEQSSSPVQYYPVQITGVDSSLVILTQTNAEGIYLDSLFLEPAQMGAFSVEVLDCKNEVHKITFNNLDTINVANFLICKEPQDCMAMFSWESEVGNDLQINFTDQSEGNITSWFWNFGDSFTSEEQNPVHVYAQPGEYLVSLTINDSLENCFDAISEWIYVGDTLSCSADFAYRLDSLSNDRFTYLFEDLSSGDIKTWSWDFGDGNTSDISNPVHSYTSAGTYTVCLVVTGGNEGINCQDEYCMTITTTDYHNFGGHAFLGDFPLNVEDNDSSNMAVASLYLRYENQWRFLDSRQFWKYGYYWFSNKLAGEYLVRIDLLPESVDFGNYTPSYYGNTINWSSATTFTLGTEEKFDVNINLVPLGLRPGGIGSISGLLEKGQTCVGEVSTEGSIIYLFDDQNNLIDFTYVGPSRAFTFDGLLLGRYSLRVEMTGRFGEMTTVNLTESNPTVDEVNLFFDCNAFVGVGELAEDETFAKGKVYPQPVEDHFFLNLTVKEPVLVYFELIDLNGSVILSRQHWLKEGNQSVSFDQLEVKTGMYFLKTVFLDNNNLIVNKVLVY